MSRIADAQTRWRARSFGRLPNMRAATESVAIALLARARLPGQSESARLSTLLTACRRTSSPILRRALHAQLAPYLTGEASEIWRRERIGWERYFTDFGRIGESARLPTSLLLKEPGPNGEKGVLYVSFEYNWMRLLAHHDVRALLRDYLLVGATSWSPTDFASFASLSGLSDDPVFMCISHPSDMDAYRVMAPVVEPVPIMACDWVNPIYYQPKPHAERTIDVLMVANWLPFKRHWLLFDALSRMPRNLRVVLVGHEAPDRRASDVLDEARAFGVQQELEFRSRLDIETVTALQCDARLSVLLSQREGSCVAPAECFFANTPVVMMADAHVGVQTYISAQTGALASRRTLARTMTDVLAAPERFAPRQWAEANISCHRASERLNAQLRAHVVATGRPWTRDIAPMTWRYMPTYIDDADHDRMAPAVERLRRDHGVELVPPKR